MPPFASDGVGAGQKPPAYDDAAADAGAQNDAEHHLGIAPGAVGRFGEREAVGVVGDAHPIAQAGAQVVQQRLAVQPC